MAEGYPNKRKHPGQPGENFIGRRYGKLRVLEFVGRDRRRQKVWKCRCDCGNEIIAGSTALRAGKTVACWCITIKPIEEGFWPLVSKQASGCWEWIGRLDQHGYGEFFHDGRSWKAHRLAWVLRHGSIKKGMCACHKCDNRKCVNPDHIFIGTNVDNLKDMHRKGRGGWGERNGNAKFTAEEVRGMILEHREKGTSCTELAERRGVDPSTVSLILLGKSWRRVTRDLFPEKP